MSLRTRLAVFVAIAVGASVAIVAFAGYRSARDEALAEIDSFLLGRAGLVGLVESLDPGSGRGGPRSGAARVVAEDVVAQLITAEGNSLSLSRDGVVLPVEQQDIAVALGAPQVLRTVAVDGVNYRMLTRRAGPRIGLQVARDLSESETILAGIRNRLMVIGLLGAALASLLGWLLAGRALRPVTILTEAAEDVAATGALDAPISVDRSDEIGRLASAYNAMLARLQSSRAAQQRLVADASHELRTPLTSLRTNIELLAREGLPDDVRRDMVADLEAEISELGTLVSELVDLATVGRTDEARIEADLYSLAVDAVLRARRRSPGLEFVVTGDSHVAPIVVGDVERAIANLLDNAVKWSPAGASVEVAVSPDALLVRDRGPGFDPDDLPMVFERFFRSTKARSKPGSGLGLSIVAAVAADHGWETVARNREGGGAEVGFGFPGGVGRGAA